MFIPERLMLVLVDSQSVYLPSWCSFLRGWWWWIVAPCTYRADVHPREADVGASGQSMCVLTELMCNCASPRGWCWCYRTVNPCTYWADVHSWEADDGARGQSICVLTELMFIPKRLMLVIVDSQSVFLLSWCSSLIGWCWWIVTQSADAHG